MKHVASLLSFCLVYAGCASQREAPSARSVTQPSLVNTYWVGRTPSGTISDAGFRERVVPFEIHFHSDGALHYYNSTEVTPGFNAHWQQRGSEIRMSIAGDSAVYIGIISEGYIVGTAKDYFDRTYTWWLSRVRIPPPHLRHETTAQAVQPTPSRRN